MTDSDGLAKRLIAARSKQGLSQQALADASGVAAAQISRYESSRSAPRPEVTAKLAKALGVSFEWLLEGHGEGSESSDESAEGAATYRISLALPLDLMDRLKNAAVAAERSLAHEMRLRLEASFSQSVASEADGWDRMRALRQQANSLAAERANLQRTRDEFLAEARKKSVAYDEPAQRRLWEISSRVYDIEHKLRETERAIDDLYDRLATAAPGAGRTSSGT